MLFNFNKENLFIIDDNSLSRLMLREFVNDNFKYKVRDFMSVEDCLDKFPRHPRIILLDYYLPGMNGLQAIPVLKKKWPKAQIVVVSCQRDLGVASNLIRSNIVEYVEKTDNLEKDIVLAIEHAEYILKSRDSN